MKAIEVEVHLERVFLERLYDLAFVLSEIDSLLARVELFEGELNGGGMQGGVREGEGLLLVVGHVEVTDGSFSILITLLLSLEVILHAVVDAAS